MLGSKGPAQPFPTLGDALNAGYCYLEVRYLGYDTSQTHASDIVRRPKSTPTHELERYAMTSRKSAGYPLHTQPKKLKLVYLAGPMDALSTRVFSAGIACASSDDGKAFDLHAAQGLASGRFITQLCCRLK
jgi:hypothetical protein